MTNLEYLITLPPYEIAAVIYLSCDENNVFNPASFAKFLEAEYSIELPNYKELDKHAELIFMVANHPEIVNAVIRKFAAAVEESNGHSDDEEN